MNEIIYFFAVVPIFLAIIYAFYHVITKHERRYQVQHIVIIGLATILAWTVSYILKNTIVHPRPDLVRALFVPNGLYSFPSGHASFMFGLAFAMYAFDKHAGKVLFILAFITGVARVLAGVHFWYDIFAGALVGASIASVVIFFINYFFKK